MSQENLLILAIAIMSALLGACLMVPFGPRLSNLLGLEFFGSMIGASLGAAAAIFAVLIQLRIQFRKNEEDKNLSTKNLKRIVWTEMAGLSRLAITESKFWKSLQDRDPLDCPQRFVGNFVCNVLDANLNRLSELEIAAADQLIVVKKQLVGFHAAVASCFQFLGDWRAKRRTDLTESHAREIYMRRTEDIYKILMEIAARAKVAASRLDSTGMFLAERKNFYTVDQWKKIEEREDSLYLVLTEYEKLKKIQSKSKPAPSP